MTNIYLNLTELHETNSDDIWSARHQPTYRLTLDYLLVVSHVCFDLYNTGDCRLPDGTWNNELDGRGEDYMAEFIDEVHNVIKDIVK